VAGGGQCTCVPSCPDFFLDSLSAHTASHAYAVYYLRLNRSVARVFVAQKPPVAQSRAVGTRPS
jgi:hypothetical protein